MKLIDLFEAQSTIAITNSNGVVRGEWKTDLIAEEDENYLPSGYRYDRVLELQLVEASTTGEGKGDALMNEFLKLPAVKKAELIFLDPNPNLGKFAKFGIDEEEQLNKLRRFYEKHGFRSRQDHGRMWRVQKGSISKSELPT